MTELGSMVMSKEYQVRVPKTLAETFVRQRSSLAKKIATGIKSEGRGDWGPVISVTDEEADALHERATEMRAREGAPAREVSAAVKMIETLNKVRNPVQFNSRPPSDTNAEAEARGYEIAKPSPEVADLLAAAIGGQRAAPAPTPPARAPRHNEKAPTERAAAPAPRTATAHMVDIERQLIRIETVMDIIGEELPGARRVLEEALSELRLLCANRP